MSPGGAPPPPWPAPGARAEAGGQTGTDASAEAGPAAEHRAGSGRRPVRDSKEPEERPGMERPGMERRRAAESETRPGPGAGAEPPAGREPRLVHTARELRALDGADAAGGGAARGERAVVMTMGALHEGHAALIRAARQRVGARGQVVVTVFVNPLQFGPGEDLDRYPRTLGADWEVAQREGADVVFAPSAEEVYPGGEPQVRLSAGPMGTRWEGASRPGHFDGVLTVVAKLLHLTAPDVALYGQKDAQQLALVSRMVRDLDFPVEIVGVPTVREADGLALSSRNRYLSAEQRVPARELSRALFAAEHAAPDGPLAAVRAARSVLDRAVATWPELSLDYLALVDPSDFTELPLTEPPRPSGPAAEPASPPGSDAACGDVGGTGEAVLAVAARVGATRLIDNVRLSLVPSQDDGAGPRTAAPGAGR